MNGLYICDIQLFRTCTMCSKRSWDIYCTHALLKKKNLIFCFCSVLIRSGRRKICQNNDVIEIYCIVFLSPSFRCCLLQIMKIN